MTKQEIIKSAIGILLLGMLAEALWLYEIQVHIGWASLNWLRNDLFSPLGVGFCAATAYLLPFIVKYRQINGKVVLTWFSLICLNIAVFYFGEAVLKSLFSRLSFILSLGQSLKIRFFGLFAVGLFSFGYYLITDKLIIKVRKQQLVLFILSTLLMFVLGNITVFFIHGFGNRDALVDAVKMGYPQFWICILLGLSGILTLVYFSEEEG
jgi:hypothetical protein